MASKRPTSKLHFALGATVAGGLAFTPAAGMAEANPFQVAELDAGYMVADSHKGEEGQCAGKDKAKEGECASQDKDRDKTQSEGQCAGKSKEKSKEKGGEGKCGEGKCAGA